MMKSLFNQIKNRIPRKILKENLHVLFWHKKLMTITLLLTFGVAGLEALGTGMVIPILQSVQGHEIDNFFIRYAKFLMNLVSLEYTFVNLMLAFLGLMLVKYIVIGFQKYVTKLFSATIKMDLRRKSFDSLMKQPLSFYYDHRTGDLHAVVFNSTDLAGGVSETILLMASSLCLASAYILINSLISFKLTVLAIVLFGLALLMISRGFRFGRKYGEEEKELKNKISVQVIEALSGLKSIKSYGNETNYRKGFRELLYNYRDNVMKLELNEIFSILLYDPIMLVMVVILMIVSIKLFSMNVLVMITFFYVFVLLAPQVRAINNQLMQIMKNLPHFSHTYDVIYWKSHLTVPEGAFPIKNFQSEIEFRNVSFKYPSGQGDVLKGINFKISRGASAAFVGMSGGGKSTLLDLLIRHHPITEGEILIDGVNLMAIEHDAWNRLIGIVEQTPYIFQGSVGDNIRFGKLDATDSEVIQAAKDACAHDFIAEMPHGYATLVGNQGIELSGGQKQRLALARALIKNPAILILDEATSALDSESEEKIQKSIDRLGKEKTILIVAHRLSTIMHADKILLIENGQVMEEGNHGFLLNLKGRYRKYFDLQWKNNSFTTATSL